MEEKHLTPQFGAPQDSCAPKAKEKRIYEADSRDWTMLFLTWGVGTLFAALILGPGMPGLGITLGVMAWYGALFLYRGKRGTGNRASVFLMLAVMALALTFSIWSNVWLRRWNLIFLLGLMAVQMIEWFELGNRSWVQPTMLLERGYLVLQGLLGNLPASVMAVGVIGKPCGKRGRVVALGVALTLPLAAVAVILLLQADGYFAFVVERLMNELGRIFGDAVVRLLLGLLMVPALFGLCYSLRYGKRKGETVNSLSFNLDSLAPAMVLGVMDLLYGFFLAVQSAALFGGPAYLERVAGLSYAEYARSGFFQLVFVAILNLAVILAALQFSRTEGGAWKAVRFLSTAMIAMSGAILFSAAYRMTLYVQVYGLSFKRFLTYWGMVMLGIFFLAAALKIWKKGFSFFKVLFTASIVGWLALNACNVDRIVATYNVGLYQRQEIAAIDLKYVVNELSYDALDTLEGVSFERPIQNDIMAGAIRVRRTQAAKEISHWQTWCLSAYLAANYGGT